MNNLLIEVARRYSEPHRKYHTLKHVMGMFTLARDRGIELSDQQVLAIWLHDIVYRVPADPNESNEMASVRLARGWLSEICYPTILAVKVALIIKDTEQELPTGGESAVVIDLDLSGLSLNYWKNRKLVREEYGCYSDEQFKAGRRKWVKGMLKRKSIFVSGKFDDLEAEAVKNLKKDGLLCCLNEADAKLFAAAD